MFITNDFVMFTYTLADDVVKEEFIGKYRYFGGLQCDYHESSNEYRMIEKWLSELAEAIFNFINN